MEGWMDGRIDGRIEGRMDWKNALIIDKSVGMVDV